MEDTGKHKTQIEEILTIRFDPPNDDTPNDIDKICNTTVESAGIHVNMLTEKIKRQIDKRNIQTDYEVAKTLYTKLIVVSALLDSYRTAIFQLLTKLMSCNMFEEDKTVGSETFTKILSIHVDRMDNTIDVGNGDHIFFLEKYPNVVEKTVMSTTELSAENLNRIFIEVIIVSRFIEESREALFNALKNCRY